MGSGVNAAASLNGKATTSLREQISSQISLQNDQAALRRSSSGRSVYRNTHLHRLDRMTLIDPRTNFYVAYWDLITTAALLFTAFVTPVEVAFMQPPPPSMRWVDPLFLLNRVVDLIFIIDMVFVFRSAYKSHTTAGTLWVTDSLKIARHYVFGGYWFVLDLFSVSTSIFDLIGDDSTSNLTALRAVRTLRLIKLLKLARGSRIFKRWEMRVSIDYGVLRITTICTTILLCCHWTACLWGLEATFAIHNSWPMRKGYCVAWGHTNFTVATSAAETPCGSSHAHPSSLSFTADSECCPDDWYCYVGSCTNGVCFDGYACAPVIDMYAYSLYFAIMTVTSVGYGDISAAPFNVGEQIVCCFIMLLSGMIWGYLIGVFCTIAGVSPTVQTFRDELSELNNFMREFHLESKLRFRLREYLHETMELRVHEARKKLLALLSPSMQGEVSLIVNQQWVRRVWYLRSSLIPLALTIELAAHLKAVIFPPNEYCPTGFMYIMHRGTGLFAGKPLREGSVWGEDVLLGESVHNAGLQLDFCALAVSYLSVYTLSSRQLISAVSKYPEAALELDRIRRLWSVRRAVVREAERICYSNGKHFHGRTRPIYAKEIVDRLSRQRRLDRIGSMHAQRHMSMSPSSKRKLSTNVCQGGRFQQRQRSKSLGAGVDQGGCGGGREGRRGTVFTQMLALSPSRAHHQRPSLKKGGQESSLKALQAFQKLHLEKEAASDFGLHLRTVQMTMGDDAMLERTRMSALYNDVSTLQRDMRAMQATMGEMLGLLKQGKGVAVPPRADAMTASKISPSCSDQSSSMGVLPFQRSQSPNNSFMGPTDALQA